MRHVFFNFQGNAVFGVLAFLGTALALLAIAAILVFLLATGRRRAAKWIGLAAGALVAIYAVLLVVHSARSRPQVAEIGEEKYFCEVDCHLAYSVTDVRREKNLYRITLRTRFDPDTISSRRGNGLLRPNGRRVFVRDASGREYPADPEGAAGLASPLRPGESYTTLLVFDLPGSAGRPELLVVESSPVTRLLIGHENSLGHEKTRFRL